LAFRPIYYLALQPAECDLYRLMDAWHPITAEEMLSVIDRELQDCTLEQRRVLDRYRVALRPTLIERYGKLGSVFVVAQRGEEVMYWEDIEEGFNVSRLTPDGQIAEHGFEQDKLRHALLRRMTH
jgi:hypothetical protein